VIYSRWRPEGDGYDYFDVDEVVNINDDLPTPDLREAGRLGVPSIEAGRPIPAGASWVGNGDDAIGLVAPVDSRRLVSRSHIGALEPAPRGGADAIVLVGVLLIAGVVVVAARAR